MKLKTLFIAALVAVAGLTGHAQTRQNVHSAMHGKLLANAGKSRIDKSSATNFLLEDMARRDGAFSMSAEKENMVNDLLTEARKHIGKPYRHGSKGPSAFDCSGFSSYVYRQFGYKISPASRAQYLEGEAVDRNELQKGDLVFFTSRSSGKNVGHVGIVVSADNETGKFKFIHASIKGVKISENEGYYANRYVGARRIIK